MLGFHSAIHRQVSHVSTAELTLHVSTQSHFCLLCLQLGIPIHGRQGILSINTIYLRCGRTHLLVHLLNANANCPPVCLELLHLGQLHHSPANVSQSFSRQVGAGDMLDKGPEVDTRVLLGVSIRCCISQQSALIL